MQAVVLEERTPLKNQFRSLTTEPYRVPADHSPLRTK